ncbi:TIGR01777 family protein [Kocuria sp. JC486]|uniref:TIGR01777 family oxidoreductase n=1 Tax=Kocuria sp. JC486 TaxID=1970736 RepID=UPI0014229FE0|nr:TIGR01777 family oxidoreductase [Kocuria sp. JC486]NHU86137.1 TIGR01777 family protein [Kocuria sp. JC486]
MAVFESTEHVGHPAEDVYQWHRRPGALTRLSPEWAQTVVEESYPPLVPGTRARLKTAVPGTAGTVRVPFVAEHDDGPTPRSFVDRMVKGPMRSWTHTHVFDGDESCMVRDRVEYELLPGGLGGGGNTLGKYAGTFTDRSVQSMLTKTFADRTARLRADLDLQAALWARSGQRLNVLIGGASGLVGSQVAALLSTGGHQVRRLVRGEARRADEVRWDPASGDLDPAAVAWADVIVHLGGASIATRFTDKNKQKILSSRVDSTELIAKTCAAIPAADRPQAFVCASAVGAYGADSGDRILTEDQPYGDGFLAEVCREWEARAAKVEDLGMRRVSIRTGLVLSSLGGLLRVQLPLYLAGMGGPVGTGRQWMSWVSLDDMAGIYATAVVDDAVHGPVNAVAPNPVRQADFAKELGRALHRPAVLPVPAMAPAALLGREASRELALASQRVAPRAMEAVGYGFRHSQLRDALAWTLPPQGPVGPDSSRA